MATQYAGLPAVTGETDIVTALTFDASLVVPTSSVTTPPHVWQPVAIYLGLPAYACCPMYTHTGCEILDGLVSFAVVCIDKYSNGLTFP